MGENCKINLKLFLQSCGRGLAHWNNKETILIQEFFACQYVPKTKIDWIQKRIERCCRIWHIGILSDDVEQVFGDKSQTLVGQGVIWPFPRHNGTLCTQTVKMSARSGIIYEKRKPNENEGRGGGWGRYYCAKSEAEIA